jgi:hypothetical protein
MKKSHKKKYNKKTSRKTRKTRTKRRKGGDGNIDTDVNNVKIRTYEQFVTNFSLPIFSKIMLNFMEIYPFYNRNGQYTLGNYFSRYVEDNSLDYTPISNYITDFNKVLNDTMETNIQYINPNYFQIKEQFDILLPDLYNQRNESYDSHIDYYIDCLNASNLINSEIYDIILNKNTRFTDDIFEIPPDENEKFKYYLKNNIFQSEPPDYMNRNQPIDYFSDIDEIFDINDAYLEESFEHYQHYMDLRIKQKAYYNQMVNKNKPYLPPELDRMVKSYL